VSETKYSEVRAFSTGLYHKALAEKYLLKTYNPSFTAVCKNDVSKSKIELHYVVKELRRI
jgi:hypothetical protein